jgi:hypothetical protein
MPDRFSRNLPSLVSPATAAFTITPSDTLDLPEVTRAVYIGASGALAVRMSSGQTITFSGVIGGSTLPIRIDRVLATGTTATGVVGLV